MYTPRQLTVRMLEQLTQAIREMSDEDFDLLRKGELRPLVSFSAAAPRTTNRERRATPVSEDTLREVHSKLTAADSREEGQQILLEVLAHKEDLFALAKFLDLPVQRRDKMERIRDKIVTFTVGRRLSGEAVRGSYGKE